MRPADSEPSASSRSRWRDDLLGVPVPEEHPLEQVHRHREPVLHQPREVPGVQHEEARRFRHPDRVVVDLSHPVEVRVEGPGVGAAVGRPRHLEVVSADPPQQDGGAVQQHVEAGGRVAFAVQQPGLDKFDVPVAAQPGQLLVVQLLEQEQGAQFLGAARHLLAVGEAYRFLLGRLGHQFLQISVHQHDGHGALAHGRGDALGRLGPRVAGHEDAGNAGLQVVREAVQSPALGPFPLDGQVRACHHEPALIARHDVFQPVGERGRADEQEQPRRVDGLGRAGRGVTQRQALQVLVALGSDDLGAGADRDVRDVPDLLDQVERHRPLQRRPADQDRHGLGAARQVHGGLPGGVRAADDVHVLVGARGGLGERGPVVDPAAGHVVEAGRGEAPVGDAGGEDHGVRVNSGAVREADAARGPVDLQADHVARGQHLGPELGRLPAGPLGQLRPGHPVREAEVVLDPRALARLPSGRGALDQHRAQPLGRAVHRRAQPGRAAADDDQVVEVLGGRGGQSHLAGQLGVGRLHQRLAVRGDHDRQPEPVAVGGLDAGRAQQPLPFRLVRGVPAVRHLVAGQELAHLRRARRPPVADDLGLRDRPVVRAQPRLEQPVHHGVELLFRRVPGLEQVVVQVDDVDRVDRGVGVGVGGQQYAFRPRVDVHRLLEELDPVHLRHAVVGQDHRDHVAAQFHLPQRVQRRFSRLGAHDPVLLAVAAPQVPGDRAGHARVVVHSDDRRTG